MIIFISSAHLIVDIDVRDIVASDMSQIFPYALFYLTLSQWGLIIGCFAPLHSQNPDFTVFLIHGRLVTYNPSITPDLQIDYITIIMIALSYLSLSVSYWFRFRMLASLIPTTYSPHHNAYTLSYSLIVAFIAAIIIMRESAVSFVYVSLYLVVIVLLLLLCLSLHISCTLCERFPYAPKTFEHLHIT